MAAPSKQATDMVTLGTAAATAVEAVVEETETETAGTVAGEMETTGTVDRLTTAPVRHFTPFTPAGAKEQRYINADQHTRHIRHRSPPIHQV